MMLAVNNGKGSTTLLFYLFAISSFVILYCTESANPSFNFVAVIRVAVNVTTRTEVALGITMDAGFLIKYIFYGNFQHN